MRLSLILFVGLFSISTQAGEKVEHICGNGPHTIKVLIGLKSVCEAQNPILMPDDTYKKVDSICRDVPNYESQKWSDWPECKGASELESLCYNCITITNDN